MIIRASLEIDDERSNRNGCNRLSLPRNVPFANNYFGNDVFNFAPGGDMAEKRRRAGTPGIGDVAMLQACPN